MSIPMSRARWTGLSLGLALGACGVSGDSAPSVTASDAWARATAPAQTMAAAYVTLRSNGHDRLVGVSTPIGSAGLHESMDHGGMAMMKEATGFDLPAGKDVALEPGAKHVMITGLTAPLEPGQQFPMTLDFDKAPDLTIAVRVVAAGSR